MLGCPKTRIRNLIAGQEREVSESVVAQTGADLLDKCQHAQRERMSGARYVHDRHCRCQDDAAAASDRQEKAAPAKDPGKAEIATVHIARIATGHKVCSLPSTR